MNMAAPHFARALLGQLILATTLMFATVSTQAVSLPFYDGFDYSEGNLNAVATPTWAAGNGSSTFEIAVSNAAALTAPPGYPAANGKGVRRAPSASARRSVLTIDSFTPSDGAEVYVSFLLNVQTAPASAQCILQLDTSSSSVTSPDLGVFVDAGPKVGVGKNASAPGYTMPSNLTPGTHLVVACYTFQAGNDKVSLWVDPSSTDYGAASAPAPLGTHTNSGDPATFGFCQIVTSSGAGSVMQIDEYRLGSTWAQVVPAGGPLVGAKLGFTTQPAGAAPNATMSPVVVQVQTASGAAVASNGVPVTLTLTAGSGTLSGALTQNTDSSGKATFSNLSVDTAGTGKQLTATASGIGTGLTNAVSTAFTIADPSVATKLAFTTQPADAAVNTVLGSVVVQVQDASNVAVATNGVPVTVALTSGVGTLNGTLTQNTDGTGKATFSNLSVDTIGTGKQLTASASGLTSATSSAFAITNAGGGGSGSPGLNISQTRILNSGYEVAGTNGTPVTFAQIVGSPSLNVPLSNWMLVAYGNLDGSGNITFTNPVSPALPNAYYRLRTGNTSTKLEPPSILAPPQSQIVSAGTTATFNVGAVGPLLQYLWYFNGTPIKNATNSSLVIPNAQAGNVGNYHVVVANPGGSGSSPVATLGIGDIAPTITSHPADQNVTEGNSAIFSVTATGTSPLTYQWYFNTNTPVAGGTNATLALVGVTTNNAGKYACTVANNFGSAPSSNATLSIAPTPTGLPNTNALGWAAFAGVTGGEYGGNTTTITCSDYASFSNAVRNVNPLIIYVDGWITNTEAYCYIYGPNKSIVGLGTNSGFFGDLRVNATNVIIRNLSFAGTLNNSDLITIDGGTKGTGKIVWVDHCTFYDAPDGSVDITKGADYVTVSWCKFSYAYAPPGTTSHEYVNLIGSSDGDTNVNFHVTFHHNWWGDHCRERMPSVRAGHVHVFNNYYNCTYNNYCIRTRLFAELLVENNYFIGVQNPWERLTTSAGGSPGLLKATGNITNNCTWSATWYPGVTLIPGTDTLGSDLNPPPYSYPLDAAADVPYYIQTYAGHGKYPFGP